MSAGHPGRSEPRMIPETSPPPVGRIAPSPTGHLHLGHARSFVIAWWHARSLGGRLVVRLDDLDVARARPEFADQALADLEWLGLDWDGTPLLQSLRRDAFALAAAQLEGAGLAYACTCSRGDIRQAVNAPHAGEEEPPYPGTCASAARTRSEAERISGKRAGLRFRVPADPIEFIDQVHGRQRFDLVKSPGDFLISRRDETPAYQLSVVVDDAHQGVTDVVRGDDLLSSTPRQLALIGALRLSVPRYHHLPLVVDSSGRRLAKRHDALSLARLRQSGVDPRRVIAWVAASAGLPISAPVDVRSALPLFDMARLPRSPVVAPDIDAWL